MSKKQVYQLNDKTLKYQSLAQSRRQHQYLGLPSVFKARLPQEVIFPNMDSGRADEFYCTEDGTVIDLEEESGKITSDTLKKFSKYVIFGRYMYSNKIYLGVICHQNPGKEYEIFKDCDSIYVKVHYIYFKQEDLWKKYENIINKVKHKEKLTDMEALDMAFVSKFISKKHAPKIVESLAKMYDDAIIDDKSLKIDVGIILGGMILKHTENVKKQKRLLEMINMIQIQSDWEKLIYDEYGEELTKKDEELEAQSKKLNQQAQELKNKNDELKSKNDQINKLIKSNNEYKKKIKELGDLDDLDPKVKEVINYLMIL